MKPERLMSSADLRASAAGYRQEASALAETLDYLTAPAADAAQSRIGRYRALASDLERAAQRMEAVGR